VINTSDYVLIVFAALSRRWSLCFQPIST